MRRLIELPPREMLAYIAQMAPKPLYQYEGDSNELRIVFNPETGALELKEFGQYARPVSSIPSKGYVEVEWYGDLPTLAFRKDAPGLLVTLVRCRQKDDGNHTFYDVPGHNYALDDLEPATKDHPLITKLLGAE